VTDGSFRLDAKNLTATTLDRLFAELHDGVEVESFDIREHAACGDGVASTADRISLDVSYRENGAGLPRQIILKTLLLHPPQTQGEIERRRHAVENVVKPPHRYFPWDLEAAPRDFVQLRAVSRGARQRDARGCLPRSEARGGLGAPKDQEASNAKEEEGEPARGGGPGEDENRLLAQAIRSPELFDDVQSRQAVAG
jgi:hypothetical protein